MAFIDCSQFLGLDNISLVPFTYACWDIFTGLNVSENLTLPRLFCNWDKPRCILNNDRFKGSMQIIYLPPL